MAGRDIVVIGGSAGAIPAMQQLLAELPASLRASLFIVIHSAAFGPSFLADVLSNAGVLPASFATHGERFVHGRIYVAPPDRHLLLQDGVMHVTRGPRENGFRPAVDPLFRTAAEQHGTRVVGVVLSGGLDDGTYGLQLIKRHGGVAVAQRIEEAAVPSMPLSAIQNVAVDHILSATEIGPLITRLASAQVRMTKDKRTRHRQDVAEHGSRELEHPPNQPPTPFTCPECGGALWEKQDGRVDRFHCHIGHGFTAEALADGIDGRLETALWTALRSLEESAAFQHRLAQRARDANLTAMARAHDARAAEAKARAATIQAVLTATDRRETSARRNADHVVAPMRKRQNR
jgi:two-component system chemotaxis response regulator CheB